MRSVITGATGFIGHSLLRALVGRGERVVAVSRQPHSDDEEKLVDWRVLPPDGQGWDEILEGVTTVYHFGWSSLPQTSNEDPRYDAADNILGTLRLLDAAKKKAGLRFVFLSSGGTVYGILSSVPANEQHDTRPRCAYGVSKLAIEKYLGLYHDVWGLDGVALRISNAYGPGQKVGRNFGAVSTFVARVTAGESITIFGDGTITRDYLYIDDLIDAVIAAGLHRGGPTVMNVGSGVGKSLNDIVDVLGKIEARKINVNYVAQRDLDVPVSVLDISLAERILKWTPRTSFEAGVAATLQAMRAARVME